MASESSSSAENTGGEEVMTKLPPEEAIRAVLIAFISIALYNFVELNCIILATFKQRRGIYFWAFVVSTWGIACNAIGYLLKHLDSITTPYVYATIIVIGWCAMVTGQSVVLFSRLHLVVHSQNKLRAVLALIIFNAVAMHIPVTALVYGVNSNTPEPFVKPYTIYEKVQTAVFFIQETIISALYIVETAKLRSVTSANNQNRRLMNHLIYINLVVIALDISILAFGFANYRELQTAWKPFVYSAKLKIEFNILNKLVDFTHRPRQKGSSYFQSHGNGGAGGIVERGHGCVAGLGTFDGVRGSHSRDNVGYKAHVNTAVRPSIEEEGGGITQKFEVAVQSERAIEDHDTDSLDSFERSLGFSTLGRRNKGYAASSASSEFQFAGNGY